MVKYNSIPQLVCEKKRENVRHVQNIMKRPKQLLNLLAT